MPSIPSGAAAIVNPKSWDVTEPSEIKQKVVKLKGFSIFNRTYRLSYNTKNNQFYVQRKRTFLFLSLGWKDKIDIKYEHANKHKTSQWIVRTALAYSPLLTAQEKATQLDKLPCQEQKQKMITQMREVEKIHTLPDHGYVEPTYHVGRNLSPHAERVNGLMSPKAFV
ncbi:hypothetical protein SOPP22_14790 [Shewanella sp. OPT22]|nr:hypothetical protein SOPP22_14790 [Shewanella sp. OPT22]